MAVKTITAKWPGKCHYCAQTFEGGSPVKWDSLTKAVYHPACYETIADKIAEASKPDPSVLLGAGMPIVHDKGKGVSLQPGAAVKLPPKVQKLAKAAQAAGYAGVKTQKARGIVALQAHGMLSKAFARIAVTEDQAVEYAEAQGLPCFVRPCPITPRHGFVDSRVVKTVQEVRQVWTEAREADPEAELIVMPFINATVNMCWRPGMLSIGPGHDGATGGHASVSVILQPEYSQLWKQVASDAGVKDTDDPFLEAVSAPIVDTVITQVRGGVKGAPTAADWNPVEGFTVTAIVTLTDAEKKEPGKMLAWETEACALAPGTVVYTPGDNLASHWAVHAQLQLQKRGVAVPVLTSFQPVIGQSLPKLGVDLVPLDPSAIVWGYLGGLLTPDLAHDLGNRKRAVCAAVMACHHGLRMGGDAGVHLGASVAVLLRLSQAALWGEARHALHGGLSRDQVYKSVLDNWETGRAGLGGKVNLFHTHKWGGGFGGAAWAMIGHATMDLDLAMLQLIQDPSEARATHVVGQLNNLINLAHNNGWFLNKFCEAMWFDLAAALDPRVALMAGPIWYAATLTPAHDRMALLNRIETLDPVACGHKPPKHGKTVMAKSAPVNAKLGAGDGGGSGAHGYHVHGPKVGQMGGTFGEPVNVAQLPGKPVSAQAKILSGDTVHVQILNAQKQYVSGTVDEIPEAVMHAIAGCKTNSSAGGTATPYHVLTVNVNGRIYAGPDAVFVVKLTQ